MGLNYLYFEKPNIDNNRLPKWAEDEHLYNCEGNFRGLFIEFILDRILNIFG
ncbi:MAG: hypothetical protein K6G72_10180 [Lachnospiraceae bacterium]|nr:hypothetical protein [Lachnospiraceae bacterium]